MSSRENMVRKVRALFAKTVENGCTQAEALAALARGRAMMDAHGLTDEDLKDAQRSKAILKRADIPTDPHQCKAYLGVAVSNFCGVKIICDSGDNMRLCYIGLPADTEFAEFLVETLAGFVLRELDTFMADDRSIGERRKRKVGGFVAGCTQQISKRLDELKTASARAQGANGQALVATSKALIAEKLGELGFRDIPKDRTTKTRVNGDARAAGQAAGERASLSRPIRQDAPREGLE